MRERKMEGKEKEMEREEQEAENGDDEELWLPEFITTGQGSLVDASSRVHWFFFLRSSFNDRYSCFSKAHICWYF